MHEITVVRVNNALSWKSGSPGALGQPSTKAILSDVWLLTVCFIYCISTEVLAGQRSSWIQYLQAIRCMCSIFSLLHAMNCSICGTLHFRWKRLHASNNTKSIERKHHDSEIAPACLGAGIDVCWTPELWSLCVPEVTSFGSNCEPYPGSRHLPRCPYL